MDAQKAAWQDNLEYVALSDLGLRRTNNQDSTGGGDGRQPGRFAAAWAPVHGGRRHGGPRRRRVGQQIGRRCRAADLPQAARTGPRPTPCVRRSRTPTTRSTVAARPARTSKAWARPAPCWCCCRKGPWWPRWATAGPIALRGNRYEQLTFDHSLVWEMRAAGQLPTAMCPTTSPRTSLPARWGRIAAVQVDLEGPLPADGRRHVPALQRRSFRARSKTRKWA